ncbi:MAG: FliH/SctL family protein [Acidimicrobiales bacterium]
MSSELFVPASAEPTAVLPTSLQDALPELTTLQERYDRGYEKGYMAGYAEGARRAEAERAADLANHKAAYAAIQARATTFLDRAVAAIAKELTRLENESVVVTDELVEMAFQLAEAVLGAELKLRPQRALEAAADALRRLPLGPALVRVHPDDEALLRASPSALPSIRAGGEVTVLADPEVERGSCIVTSGATTLDARVSQAMARARQVFYRLGDGEAEPGEGPVLGQVGDEGPANGRPSKEGPAARWAGREEKASGQ